jgi:hypothetical protein
MGTPPSGFVLSPVASNAAAVFRAPASSRVTKALSSAWALARLSASVVSAVLVTFPARRAATA